MPAARAPTEATSAPRPRTETASDEADLEEEAAAAEAVMLPVLDAPVMVIMDPEAERDIDPEAEVMLPEEDDVLLEVGCAIATAE